MSATHWVIVALAVVCGALGTLLATGHGLAPNAMAQDSVSGSYMVAMIGEQTSQQYPLFLVDTKEMTLLVYEYDRGAGSLEFHCARSYQYDRKVQDRDFYRGAASPRTGPSVEDVKRLILQGK